MQTILSGSGIGGSSATAARGCEGAPVSPSRAAQVVDPPRREQLPQPAPVRLAEQRPGVDDAVVLEHPGPRPVAGVVADQPHARQPMSPARRVRGAHGRH